MKRLIVTITLALCAVAFQPARLFSQGFGTGRSGTTISQSYDAHWKGLPELEPSLALQFITVEGTAELRVVPEEVRVILAVTIEGASADECQTKVAERIKRIVTDWSNSKIPQDKIVEDFINVLPVYKWVIETQNGEKVVVQKHAGFRMQTNLHVAVKTESEAMQAIQQAFRHGVTDIITFDYWSPKLDEQKREARKAAIAAAKEKADTLLEIFDSRPKIVNIQEATGVFFPHAMYRTTENVLEESTEYLSNWRGRLRFKAYRPKMTFLDAPQSNADVRPAELMMRPEIAVISTVRLYYQSPGEPPKSDPPMVAADGSQTRR